MAFRFSLQKIVDLKGNQKTQAEWMLSEAIGRLRQEELSLNQLLHERNAQQERLSESAEHPTPVAELRFLQQYNDHLDTLIEKKHIDLSAAQSNVDRNQKVLLDKTLDEKVWLKAREKAFGRFNEEMLKKEQEELDEIASVRFGADS